MFDAFIDKHPLIFFTVIAVWLGGWVLASIVLRSRAGRPIFPAAPNRALFSERKVSGFSRRNLLTQIGGARHCLLVFVTDRELVVTTLFPFNLALLPEMYGLEYRVPLDAVRVEGVERGVLGNGVQLELQRPGKNPARIALRLKQPDAFVAALGTGRPRRAA